MKADVVAGQIVTTLAHEWCFPTIEVTEPRHDEVRSGELAVTLSSRLTLHETVDNVYVVAPGVVGWLDLYARWHARAGADLRIIWSPGVDP